MGVRRRQGIRGLGIVVAALLHFTTAGDGMAADTVVAQSNTQADAQALPIRIPAQSLDTALTALADQADLKLLFSAPDLAGKRTEGIEGRFTPAEALARLLAGSGFTYRFVDARTVTLEPAPRTMRDGVMVLDPVSVEMRRPPVETATSPVIGYRAKRSATGTKTDTPILEMPAAVQVVPRKVIEDQGALNLKDVYENVSSVAQAGNTQNAQTEVRPIIRGFESPVLLRNGLRSTLVGAVDLVNIERVEVLKGPASILYGALQPGGIVNYVTKRPLAAPSYSLEQQVGMYDLFRTAGDVTGPVTEDGSLLYRLNVAYTNADSFREDIELERVAAAPSFLWRPSERTELLLDFAYLRETQPYDTGIPLSLSGDPLVSRKTFFNDADLAGRRISDYQASYQLAHEFNEVWSVRHQLQFHRAEANNESLRPRGVSANNSMLLLRYQNEFRQEDEIQGVVDVTAKFDTGPIAHTLLLGTEAIFQDSDFRRFRVNAPNAPIVENADVNFTPPASQPQEVMLGETRWYALYVQDQIAMLEDGRLKLLLGGRFDIVHQQNSTDGASSPDVDDKAVTGRIGLLYQFVPAFAGYASVSQSFQPQLNGTLDASGQPLDPERGLQYELGIKASLLDDRLLATAAIFQIEKTDVAVFDQALFNATGQIANIPGVEQRSRGFEFDLVGAVTEQINVIANYSYTETETIKNEADPSVVGGRLGGVPKHKARLWMTYQFTEGPLSGFGFGGGVRYVSENSAQFATAIRLDPYAVFDLGAWYTWNALRFGLNVYNLFDKHYIVRASDRSIAHPGAPFTIVGSVGVRF